MRAIVSALLLALAALPAGAADLGSAPPASPAAIAGLPACDDPSVLSDIVERQHWAEENTWENGIRIEAIVGPRERRPEQRFPSMVANRYCQAVAALGPNLSDPLYYVISADLGFAGLGWKVDFCMPSYDYWRVYDGNCRVLR